MAVDIVEKSRHLGLVEWTRVVLKCNWTKGQTEVLRVLGGDEPRGSKPWGDIDVIPPEARRMCSMRMGGMSGKTTISSAYGLWRLMTADVRHCGAGDVPTYISISAREDLSKIALRMAVDLTERGALEECIVGKPTADKLVLRRPHDGVEVWFRCLPATAGGKSSRGMSYVGGVIDEAEQMQEADLTKHVNDEEVINAIMRRLSTGSTLLLPSTPYNPRTSAAILFKENFGTPRTAMACFAPTLYMRDDDPEVSAIVAAEHARNPRNAAREYDCIMPDVPGAFFEAATIDAAVKTNIVPTKSRATGGLDLAFIHDACGEVVIERQGNRIVVTLVKLVKPTPEKPLQPSMVRAEFIEDCKGAGAIVVATDSHEYSSTAEQFVRSGIQVVRAPDQGQARDTGFGALRRLFRDGLIDIPYHPDLISQLKAVLGHPTDTGGISIVLPNNKSGHCDLVSALVAGLHHDRRHGPIMTSDVVVQVRPTTIRGAYVT